MFILKITTVYFGNKGAHTNTLCEQNSVFLNVCVGDKFII